MKKAAQRQINSSFIIPATSMFFRRIIVRRRLIHPDKAKIVFTDGQQVSVMGRQFTISISEDMLARYSTARIRDGIVRIRLSGSVKPKQRERHASILARRAIARAILPLVEERTRRFNDLHFKSELGSVRLKDNLSNWGSCSRQNNINLDFRLLLGPQEVLDAVIVHELAHTKHRNHSRAFHDAVKVVMPDNKEKLRWLRDNGAKLNTEYSDTTYKTDILTQQSENKPIWALDS